MMSGKPLSERAAISAPPIPPAAIADSPAPRRDANESRSAGGRHGHQARDGSRTILYERLTGEAARERARQPEPRGAGLPAEIVDQIEYIEVWSTPKAPAGYDFRCYSFGGVLIASRSTRG